MRKPKFLVPVLLMAAGLALAGCIRGNEKHFDESKAITPFEGRLIAVRMTNHGTVNLNTRSGRLRQEVFELKGKVYSHTLKKQEFTVHKFPGRDNWYILQVTQPLSGKPAYYYVLAFQRGATIYQLQTQGNRSTQRIVQAAGVKFTVEKNNMIFASADDVVKGYDAIIKDYASRSRRMNWVRYYVAKSDEQKAELKRLIESAQARWKKAKESWAKGEPE
jgi:hypothetical protein